MRYTVNVERTGCVDVEADSSEEAIKIAEELSEDKIGWTEDWKATYCEVEE